MMLEPALFQRFAQLITEYTGIHIRAEEAHKLQHAVRTRAAQQQLPTPQAYYQLLAANTAAGRHEWDDLILLLTVGETYFHRDSGQVALLRQRILPELIERNRSFRSLRIWSAGCSTGEEAYSLAMLVHELLPSRADWQIVILGTDVNKQAIATARRGLYKEHALRSLDQDYRKRYFHRQRAEWELDERLRAMVSFRQVNLLKDAFPDMSANLVDVDLILCRNVFIYFDRVAVGRVLSKFTSTLRMGGYLITGHAELHDQDPKGLCLKALPESVVYQRQDVPTTLSTVTPISQSFTSPAAPVAPPAPVVTQDPAKVRPESPRTPAEELYGQARSYADSGRYEAAIQVCELALHRDALAEKPYYLLAQIAEIRGDVAAAKNFLKKILYLAPASVGAHLELGALYAREADRPRASKLLHRALDLLGALPADARIEPFADLSAAQLIPAVQDRLQQLGCVLSV